MAKGFFIPDAWPRTSRCLWKNMFSEKTCRISLYSTPLKFWLFVCFCDSQLYQKMVLLKNLCTLHIEKLRWFRQYYPPNGNSFFPPLYKELFISDTDIHTMVTLWTPLLSRTVHRVHIAQSTQYTAHVTVHLKSTPNFWTQLYFCHSETKKVLSKKKYLRNCIFVQLLFYKMKQSAFINNKLLSCDNVFPAASTFQLYKGSILHLTNYFG